MFVNKMMIPLIISLTNILMFLLINDEIKNSKVYEEVLCDIYSIIGYIPIVLIYVSLSIIIPLISFIIYKKITNYSFKILLYISFIAIFIQSLFYVITAEKYCDISLDYIEYNFKIYRIVYFIIILIFTLLIIPFLFVSSFTSF
jgi:hypothetical protein